MKVLLALLAWSFFYYDPALTKRTLIERTFATQLACAEARVTKHNTLLLRYGWKSYLNHKGWWVSPACEPRSPSNK